MSSLVTDTFGVCVARSAGNDRAFWMQKGDPSFFIMRQNGENFEYKFFRHTTVDDAVADIQTKWDIRSTDSDYKEFIEIRSQINRPD